MVMEQPPGRRRASTCIGCGGAIHDQYILRVSPDLEWHAACLRCAECNQFLDDNCTCFVREGKTYCKRDYVRLFGAKCSKCAKLFSSTDMVMRARDKIFHIDCFRCCVCAKHLVPGDEFALRNEALYCKDDYGCVHDRKEDNNNVKLGAKSPGDSGEENVQPKAEKEQKKREGKTTRVRTVLNEKQLHTLRTCYNANPRPDALMKEQMVEMTGLSPRVIRVWFQNKRCKDKKRQLYLRQMQEANKDGRRLATMLPIQGIHMVASSPVRHDAPMEAGVGSVDITSYQPPWKTLHEYAMQGEIDPGTPQYQALLSQMHGYSAEPMPPVSGPEGCLPMHEPTLHPQAIKYEADVGSDSYVSYLESDDSLQTSSP